MTYCHRYLWYHLKYNSWTGLPLFVYWDVFPKTSFLSPFFGYLFQFIVDTYQMVVWMICVLGFRTVRGNLDLFMSCLSGSVHVGQMNVKTVYMNVVKKKLLLHLHEFEENIENCDKFDFPGSPTMTFEECYRKDSEFVRKAQYYHLVAEMATHIGFFLSSIAANLMADKDDPWVTALVADFFIDQTTFKGYVVNFILLFIEFHLVSARMVATDYFLLGIIYLHTSYINYLEQLISSLIKANNDGLLKIEEKRYYLKLWIVQVQENERLLKSFKSILPGYLSLQYAYTIIHTCIPIFAITSTNAWTPGQQIGALGVALGTHTMFYFLTQAGNSLWLARSKLKSTFYGDWLIGWKDLRQVYYLTSMKLEKPFYFTVASIFPLSLETFLGITKLIWTYYMALRQLTGRQES